MFDEWLRSVKDRMLAPLVTRVPSRVTPNRLTILALVVGLLAALLATRGSLYAAAAAWLLNRLLDGLDGALARRNGTATPFGGYLDLMTDLMVYVAVPFGIVAGAPSAEAWRALAFLLLTFYVNAGSWMLLSAILERLQSGSDRPSTLTTVRMPPGLIAGTETILFYLSFLLIPGWVVTGFWVMGDLVLINVALRLVWAWRRLPQAAL